jgi:hypothetical protein
MPVTEDLFDLVGVLSKNEKRYCRLYIQRRVGREATNLLRLFDAIVKVPDGDNAKLRKELAGAPFLKHLSVTKAHLYKLLLKALRSYMVESTDSWRLREMADAVVVLYEHNLHGQARRMIDQASALARRVERPLVLLGLLDIDSGIDSYGLYRDDGGAGLHRLYNEGKRVIKLLYNSWYYRHLSTLLKRLMVVVGLQREGPSRERLDAVVRHHPLLRDENQALSIGARLTYYDTLEHYSRATGDLECNYLVSAQQLRYIESIDEPTLRERLHPVYRETLFRFTQTAAALGRLDEARVSYRTLCAFHPGDAGRESAMEIMRCMAEVALRTAEGDHDRLIALAAEVDEVCDRLAPHDAGYIRQIARISATYAHMMKCEYREMIAQLAIISNEAAEPLREEFEPIVRIYRIISHYELGDLDLLPYQLRSLYRYLSRRNRMHRFEATLLRLLRKLPDITTRRELLMVFESTRRELDEIACDPREWEASCAQMLMPWLDRKIARKIARKA